ncbi:MAG: hypothetical protein ACE5JN_10620 [Candidatus Methylomirabilia bacterium]
MGLPEEVTTREALLLLEALSRVKKKRFGRVVVAVSDGRVIDVEITEKVDRKLLLTLSLG